MEKTFVKIKVALKDRSKVLNRVIAVDPEISLYDFSLIALASLQASFEHQFQIMDGTVIYSLDDYGEYESIYDTAVNEISDKFTLVYDFGEDWTFVCSRMKSVFEVEYDTGNFIGKVLSGKGLGLWENNHYAFDAYYEGMVKPNSTKEYPDRGIFLPENLDIRRYGETDTDIDMDFFPDIYEENLEKVHEHYLEMMGDVESYYGQNEDEEFSDEDFIDTLDENSDLMHDFHEMSNQIVTLAFHAAMLHKKMFPNDRYEQLVEEQGKDKADLIEAGLMLKSLSETLLEDNNFEIIDIVETSKDKLN